MPVRSPRAQRCSRCRPERSLAVAQVAFRDSQDRLACQTRAGCLVPRRSRATSTRGDDQTDNRVPERRVSLTLPRVALVGLAGPGLAGEWPRHGAIAAIAALQRRRHWGKGPTGANMRYDEPLRFPTADAIIALLSDDEIENVNKHEAAVGHSDTDEYLDLEHVEQGVRRGLGPPRPVCRVLPRKAVRETTWARIIASLDADRAQAPSSGPRRCSTRNVPRRGPPQAKKSRASGE
jgi:hypothetical protein